MLYVGLEDVVEGGDMEVEELTKFSFVRVSRTSVFCGRPVVVGRPAFRVVRSLGENRARDELRDFGEEGDGEVEIE